LAEEARRIPQWTAWPEKTHYQSEYDESDHIDSAYPASWTVFPLCHTFPASDVSKRKFIPLTTGFVPKTTELLQSLGPVLRTALFSRLEPRTTLGAHTGWSDLANHVLRVHIPLSVPADRGHDGLCGTWVDGCVETHRNGRIISFDDSKTHRAFNYSDEDRIVLILDLARPDEGFPMGTSTGGHTDELDKFINQFAG
jgi:aspartyl/asparaginyl beta-hydroxylase (cupin superfamily)